MLSASADVERFARMARRHFLRFDARRPNWTWDVTSVRQALEDGHGDDRVAWLTEAMGRITTRILEADMALASQKAFFLGSTPPDDSDL